MDEKVKQDYDAAKKLLQAEFEELIGDGQLIGMRNLRTAFNQWANKLHEQTSNPDLMFSKDQVELFMTTYIEELEKQRIE